ncbi:MAG TPA: hypothetical protein VGV90_11535 [Solirubrobacteraceae bacterium]|nr:hypothetical protein [Solirubrobacteraceae bacterium]
MQVIYLSLAILMGGGLVLFGIGSDQSGGLVDAFTDDAQSGGSATESVDRRIEAQLAKVRANPRDADAWAQLAIVRFQRAGINGVAQDGSYTEDGKRRLALAAQAWERHLALEPKDPNLRAANLMVQAYQGIGQLPKAVRAKQLVTAAEDPPSSNLYQQLAALAYQAGDNRVGDLAASRAVDLAPATDRKDLRTALEAFKSQVAAQAAQGAATTTTG